MQDLDAALLRLAEQCPAGPVLGIETRFIDVHRAGGLLEVLASSLNPLVDYQDVSPGSLGGHGCPQAGGAGAHDEHIRLAGFLGQGGLGRRL